MATKQALKTSTDTKKDSNAQCNKMTAREKEVLFNKYVLPNLASIKSLTRRYTDHWQDVESNYNYCLAQLFHYIGSYNPTMKLDTWLHICVKRTCFHENKKKADEAANWTDIEMCSYDDIYQEGNEMVVEDTYGNLIDNISDEMYDILLQIPPLRLSPFMLYAQGMRIREITASEWEKGHLEKRSEDVVKSRIYWAKMELKYRLRQYGISRKIRACQEFD